MQYRRIIFTFLFLLSTTSVHADLRDGLVGWWKFDEASGNAADSSGQNNTGTATGTTITSNCKRNGCLSFNGTTDVVNIGSASVIGSLVNNFSVSVWIYSNNLSGGHRIMSASRLNSANGWAFGTSGTRLLFTTYYQADTNSTLVTLTTNKWIHVAVVFSSANVLFYVNGVYVETVSGLAGTVNSDDVFYIGSGTAPGSSTLSGQFSGLIDDVRIYNRVLSTQEVMDLYLPGVVIANGVVANGAIDQ